MDAASLFSAEEIVACKAATPAAADTAAPAPRLRLAQRDQAEFRAESLDQRLDADHAARVVWDFVQGLDLSALLGQVKAVEGHVGRDHTDPRILMALWLFATIEGVGSARKLEKLCREHRAFEWICGGVSVNYHSLADFRTGHGAILEQFLAESIALLSHEGLVDVNTVAVDGVRVRASAGSDSFRRAATLETHLHDARQQLDRLKAELELTPNELSQRQQKARQRGLRERQERLQRALKNLEDISASREKRQAGSGEDARASSTDPECRKMKMADGGYRPAYNVQLGTDVDSGIIVGAHVSNAGTDAHELQPMLEQIKTNTGKTPTHTLADGGYFSSANINQAAGEGTTLYLPLKCEKQQLEQGKDPYAPKRGDSPAEKQVRQRMKEPASKELYKLRGQSAEWANAQLRNRGLQQFRVRGLVKTCTMVIWFVLAHNLLQAHRLRAEKTKAKAT